MVILFVFFSSHFNFSAKHKFLYSFCEFQFKEVFNINFDRLIASGNKLKDHLAAMVSRAHYIDLGMISKRDYIIRIEQVLAEGLLSSRGLSEEEEQDVLDFIRSHQDRMRELSLRMAIKVGDIIRRPSWN